MKMVKISFIIFMFFCCGLPLVAQRIVLPDSLLFSGVVINTEDSQTLPNVTCRYAGRGTLSDAEGRFHIMVERGDSVTFTYVGFKPCVIVVPDTLIEKEYMVGVFMTPDTLQLSEVVVMRRWGEERQQQLINAKNNMIGILKQAYAPVKEMDAEMNQQMMINDYARSVEMKGHVDVKAGVGTQSVVAYKRLRMLKRVREEKEWLNPGEVDLLKKLYYSKKKEKLNK